MGRAYYGVLMSDGTEISHYGVKGMRWGKHLFRQETDTGTRATNQSVADQVKAYKAQQQAIANKKREATIARAQERAAMAEEDAKKSKKSSSKKGKSGSGKKASAKTKKEKEDNSPEAIKKRSQENVAKSKDLISKLPTNPTAEDIKGLAKYASEYGSAPVQIAIATANISLIDRSIKELEAKAASKKSSSNKTITSTISKAKRKREQTITMLKRLLKTGKAQN